VNSVRTIALRMGLQASERADRWVAANDLYTAGIHVWVASVFAELAAEPSPDTESVERIIDRELSLIGETTADQRAAHAHAAAALADILSGLKNGRAA
jgi:hypothetical protein